MSADLVAAAPAAPAAPVEDLLAVTVAGRAFGLPVRPVRDVLAPRPVTPVPLAPPAVAGVLNLRGRIVTAIDLRRRLGLPVWAPPGRAMSVVVEHDGELYGLIVDAVGEVLSLPAAARTPRPAGLDARWRPLCAGVHRLADGLLVVLDVSSLLSLEPPPAG